MKKFDVIGFGALNLDFIANVPTLEIAGEQYKPDGEVFEPENRFSAVEKHIKEICIGEPEKSGGGSAANTIYALANMGFSTGYIGKVGNDEHGKFLMNSLGEVNREGIVQGGHSGFCYCLNGPTKKRSILVFPNSNDTLTPEEVNMEYLRNSSYIHMTSFVGDLPFEAQKRVAQELGDQVKISFNPGQLYEEKGLDTLMPIVENSHIVFTTEQGIKLMTKEEHYADGAEQILSLGPKILVITYGKNGASVFSEDRGLDSEIYQDALPVKNVVETTGAGDVFAAGFLAGLITKKGPDLEHCLNLANQCAAESIQGIGRANYPTKAILDNVK